MPSRWPVSTSILRSLIPSVRACPGWLVAMPVALMGRRALRPNLFDVDEILQARAGRGG